MAVVTISNTGVAARLLRYVVTEKPDARRDRVLFATGVGVRAESATEEFETTRRRFGTQGKGREAYHVIQSFGLHEMHPDDPADVERAHELGVALVADAFPGVEALVVTQADGKGGQLHNHIVLNATVRERMERDGRVWEPGRKLSGALTNIDRLRERHDELLRRHGFEQHLAPVTSPRARAERRTTKDRLDEKSGRRSNHDVIRDAYWEAIAHPAVVTVDDLRDRLLTEHGITVTVRVTRRGKPEERTAWSFKLDDMPTPVRGTTLGEAFTVEGGEDMLRGKLLGRPPVRPTRQKAAEPKPPPPPPSPGELAALREHVARLAEDERAMQMVDEEFVPGFGYDSSEQYLQEEFGHELPLAIEQREQVVAVLRGRRAQREEFPEPLPAPVHDELAGLDETDPVVDEPAVTAPGPSRAEPATEPAVRAAPAPAQRRRPPSPAAQEAARLAQQWGQQDDVGDDLSL